MFTIMLSFQIPLYYICNHFACHKIGTREIHFENLLPLLCRKFFDPSYFLLLDQETIAKNAGIINQSIYSTQLMRGFISRTLRRMLPD